MSPELVILSLSTSLIQIFISHLDYFWNFYLHSLGLICLFSQFIHVCVCVCVCVCPLLLSHVWLFVSPWSVAHQALSMGFSRQEYWSGLPFPTPGNLPNPGIESASLALAGRFSLLLSYLGSSVIPDTTCKKALQIRTDHVSSLFKSFSSSQLSPPYIKSKFLK